MLQVVVVEGKRRRSLEVGGVVAGTAVLDWAAVGGPGPACPVQSGLQSRVVRVILRHAPQLRPHDAALGPRHRHRRAREWEREEGQEKQERDEEAKGLRHFYTEKNRGLCAAREREKEKCGRLECRGVYGEDRNVTVTVTLWKTGSGNMNASKLY